MRKWFVILMTVIGMTLFLLLGYGDPVGEQARIPDRTAKLPDPGGLDEAEMPRVAIKAVVSLDGQAFSVLKQATERFEARRPDVDVTVTNVKAEQLYIQQQSLAVTGEAPDVMLYPTAWVRYEAAQGRLLSLDDYIPVERQSQWFEAVRGAVRWNGYLWGVPADWDPYVFVFPSETGPVPTEGLFEAVNAVGLTRTGLDSRQTGMEQYGVELLREYVGVATISEGQRESEQDQETQESGAPGMPSSDVDVKEPGKASHNGGSTVQSDMPQDGVEEPSAVDDISLASVAAVKRGEALWAFVPLSVALLEAGSDRNPNLSISVPIPMLGGANGALPPFIGSSYVISPSTEHPAEAAEWIRYVTDPSATHERSLREGARWPVYRSLYGLPASLSSDGPKMLGSIGEQNVTPMPETTSVWGRESWVTAKPIMRLWDRVPSAYAAPPAELPGWAVP
jgi:ABC-type glycerol-3-phosphate transport system substrate-binding protein